MLRTARAGGLRGPHREHHAASTEPTPKTHPRLFTAGGERKWKVAPAGTKVHPNPNPSSTSTYIEWWWAPKIEGQPRKKVYNYTAKEVERRAGIKFADNRKMAGKIPAIREQIQKDLKGDGKTREVAMALTLIDKLYLRVGGEDGAEHDHFGATTLEKQHVSVAAGTVQLRFTGKSGVPWDVKLNDPGFARLMTEHLSGVSGRHTQVFSIRAADVNAWLAPFDATAKKFRTFHATRLAREELLKHRNVPHHKREGVVSQMFERVAARLGHTPAVDRQSYVDPMVVKAFMKGRLA